LENYGILIRYVPFNFRATEAATKYFSKSSNIKWVSSVYKTNPNPARATATKLPATSRPEAPLPDELLPVAVELAEEPVSEAKPLWIEVSLADPVAEVVASAPAVVAGAVPRVVVEP